MMSELQLTMMYLLFSDFKISKTNIRDRLYTPLFNTEEIHVI